MIIHRWHNIKQNKKISSIESEYNQRKRQCLLGKGGHWYTMGIGWGPGNISHWVWLRVCATSNLFFKPFIHVLRILPGDYQFSHSVVSYSSWYHGLQHGSPSCPSPTFRAYSSSRPLSQWCHPTMCHPLLLPPSIFPSTRVFVSALQQVA